VICFTIFRHLGAKYDYDHSLASSNKYQCTTELDLTTYFYHFFHFLNMAAFPQNV